MFTNRSVVDARQRTRIRATAWTRRSRSTRTSAWAGTTRWTATPGTRGRRRELPGEVRLHGRSLRRARGVPEDRRDVQPRGRVRSAARYPPFVRLARFSPRPAIDRGRQKVHVGSQPRVRAERRGRARNAPADGTLQDGVRIERSVHRRGQPQLRAARPALPVRPASWSPLAATTSATCCCPTRSASSAASRAPCRCRPAGSTTGR